MKSMINFVVLEGELLSNVRKMDDNKYEFILGITTDTNSSITGIKNYLKKKVHIRITGKLAKICMQYLSIGSKVLVSGVLRTKPTLISAKEIKFMPKEKKL